MLKGVRGTPFLILGKFFCFIAEKRLIVEAAFLKNVDDFK